ncbi:sensor histidine kinase YpdA [Lachnospiraceae bacterium]|nr:sensor histidine kinase YpdA [Lachnospiraceae bacterium]
MPETAIRPKLHKFLSTIRGRILFITLSLTAAIGVIVIFISYFLVSNNLRQNLLQTSETTLSFLRSSIDSNMEGVNNYIRSCQGSDKIQKFAMEAATTDNRVKREAHDFVTSTYASNSALPSHLVRMVIIGKSRKDIVQLVEASYSTSRISSEAILSLPYFDDLHMHPGEAYVGIQEDSFVTRQAAMIPFVYPIQHTYKADETGYIFAEISINTITEPIRDYLSRTDYQFYIKIGSNLYQYQNNTLVPCPDDITVVDAYPDMALHENTLIQKVYSENTGRVSFMITQPLVMDGWYVMTEVDTHTLSLNILHSFLLILLIIIIAVSFIAFVLFSFLSQTINVPVGQLQLRMKRIEEGDFSRDDSTEWEHELGDIGKTINDLSENVLHLMNQRIEQEKQKKDYEYRMLQSQINPHFMYNTLNSIKWMATMQSATGIAEMTTALSRLLKNISNGTTSLISIQQELDLVQDYFTIQKYRYGGTITLEIQIDDEGLLPCQILKFTMQPLIENAIFHGIEPKGCAGSIRIHIYKDSSGDIHIEIQDDGVGIQPEVAAGLLVQDTSAGSSFFKEIGISNVHKRLQYEFGSPYGLSIDSTPGQGTVVTILLPFTQRKE